MRHCRLITVGGIITIQQAIQSTHTTIQILAYYPHMPIGMLGIYRLLFVFLFVCLSAGNLVTDISGVGWRRAMKFCRIVDLGSPPGHLPFAELWPRG